MGVEGVHGVFGLRQVTAACVLFSVCNQPCVSLLSVCKLVFECVCVVYNVLSLGYLIRISRCFCV